MKAIFLSFRPEYYKPILYGLKKYEYRKRWCDEETVAYLYLSGKARKVVGVMELGRPIRLDKTRSDYAGHPQTLKRVDHYIASRDINAVPILSFSLLETEITLEALRKQIPGFMPPQMYYDLANHRALNEYLARFTISDKLYIHNHGQIDYDNLALSVSEIMQTQEYQKLDNQRPPISLFYATTNRSKLHNMYYRLRDYPITVLCPEDLGFHIEVEENGASVLENALIKAQAYYEAVHMPVIAGDSGVFIDGLAPEEQPGLYVRRANGRSLSDDEMIDRFIDIAKKLGKPSPLHYVTGIALITKAGVKTMELRDAPLLLTAKPNANRKHNGNPLDVITMTEDGTYFNDLTDVQRAARDAAGEQQFTRFIVESLLK